MQSLTLMNDTYIRDRIRLTTSPNLRTAAAIANNTEMVKEVFLLYLGREPEAGELSKVLAVLAKANTAALRNAAIEDLAWVLVNKVDFLINLRHEDVREMNMKSIFDDWSRDVRFFLF